MLPSGPASTQRGAKPRVIPHGVSAEHGTAKQKVIIIVLWALHTIEYPVLNQKVSFFFPIIIEYTGNYKYVSYIYPKGYILDKKQLARNRNPKEA